MFDSQKVLTKEKKIRKILFSCFAWLLKIWEKVKYN